MYSTEIGKNREYKEINTNNSATSNFGVLAVWLRGVVDIEEFF